MVLFLGIPAVAAEMTFSTGIFQAPFSGQRKRYGAEAQVQRVSSPYQAVEGELQVRAGLAVKFFAVNLIFPAAEDRARVSGSMRNHRRGQ